MTDNKDKRPDVAKDEEKKPREDVKEHWHNAEEALNEGPAGNPNPEKRSGRPDWLIAKIKRPLCGRSGPRFLRRQWPLFVVGINELLWMGC